MITAAQKNSFSNKSNIKKHKLTERRIDTLDDIVYSARVIFGDPQHLHAPVSLISHRNKSIQNLNMEKVDIILIKLSEKIFDFFQNSRNSIYTQKAYDDFFINTCRWFIDELNVEAAKNEVSTFAFGKAQKLFNMIVKYMACFEDANEYENVFRFAHMPVDTYILKQLKDKLNIDSIWTYTYTNKTSGKKSLTAKYDNTAWSFLTENQYSELLCHIRERIRNNTVYDNKSWLEVEFDWWEEMV